MTDSAEALVTAMKDTSLNVRVRACWALANLCDALCSARSVISEIDISVLHTVARLLLECAHDNEKV